MVKISNILMIIFLILCSSLFLGCTERNAGIDPDVDLQSDVLYQVSTIDALLEGLYDGDVSIKELKENGDIGLGTFNGLDGEMIVIDGDVYQIRSDGIAYLSDDLMQTPFASVTNFETDEAIVIQESINFSEMNNMLEQMLPSKNIMYAIRIDGNFAHVKVRSVPAQERPYPLLADVITTEQVVFEHDDIEGSIVGFWLPYYVEGINVPGPHLHFIDSERTSGGHVLDYVMQNGSVKIDHTTELDLVLAASDEFYSTDLLRDRGAELDTVEKDN